jgi:signal transduction histidine kinase
VEFSVERQDEEAVFRVCDRGIGIPAADQKQLFHAFHRARNASHLPGTGLGLVIVKRCVELHGGEVDCESAEGSGATFTVRLPMFEPEPRAHGADRQFREKHEEQNPAH